MSSDSNDSTRRLIPRWRYIARQDAPAETVADRPRSPRASADERFWQEKLEDWAHDPSPGTAAEVVACAGVLRRFSESREAIAYLAARRSQLSPATGDLVRYAERCLEGANRGSSPPVEPIPNSEPYVSGGVQARGVIARSRGRLRVNPRDALAYMDMARGYTTLGQARPAEQAMRSALRLAPDHRLILRAECRRLVHAGRPGEAHWLIMRNARSKHDPWLIAAEIATAQILEESPRLTRQGVALIESSNFSPAGITELAGALGTLEYMKGAQRKARQFFRLSLQAPSDNAVAQARWVAARTSGIEISADAWRTPQSFEAWCWKAYQLADWDGSLGFAKAWVRDEPFSSRAAIHATFVATTVNEDYRFAIDCARDVLIADPSDMMLRNNLAVALAYTDQLEEAQRECALLPQEEDSDRRCTYLATRGLVEFRSGALEAGRALYRQAFDCAPRALRVRVASHWLKEELRLSSRGAEPLLKQLGDAARTQKESVSLRVLELAVKQSDATPVQLSRVGDSKHLHALVRLSENLDA